MSIRTLLPLLATLLILAIPASEAAKDRSPVQWKRHAWYKYKCYVPGCDSCKAFKPYECSKCADGYASLPDGTCGCAAGFGSWASPAVANFPLNKPVCPKSSSSGKTYTMAARSNSGKYTWVDPNTYYSDRPFTCGYKYYADNKCQASPQPGYGYCACSPCPVGYNTTGNASITESLCKPIGGGDGTVRCTGKPPAAVANANPWRKQCSNKKEGLSCYASCKPGFTPFPRVIATCTKGGAWTIAGECIASTGGSACPGVPEKGADAKAWDAGCKDGAVGTTCTAACAAGFTGKATATCQAGGAGWSVKSTCSASGVVCPGAPDVSFDENARPFENCTDGKLGDACRTGCVSEWVGIYDAVCTEKGWQVEGVCRDFYAYEGGSEVTCPGDPPAVTDGSASKPWSKSEALTDSGKCIDGRADMDTCSVDCADGFKSSDDVLGGIWAICTESGWKVENMCVPIKRKMF